MIICLKTLNSPIFGILQVANPTETAITKKSRRKKVNDDVYILGSPNNWNVSTSNF